MTLLTKLDQLRRTTGSLTSWSAVRACMRSVLIKQYSCVPAEDAEKAVADITQELDDKIRASSDDPVKEFLSDTARSAPFLTFLK